VSYKRNRKKQNAVPILPWRWLTMLTMAGAAAFAYLWLLGQCDALGREIKQLEEKKAEIRKRVVNEEYRLANMKTPENIDRLLQQFGIVMALPEPGQVIVVRERNGARAVQVVADTRAARSGLRPMVHD
jgi:hypothetical protein